MSASVVYVWKWVGLEASEKTSQAQPSEDRPVHGPRRGGGRRFNAVCAAAALAWMLGVLLPYTLAKPQNDDFPQLYMAGVVAAERAWSGLYRHGPRDQHAADDLDSTSTPSATSSPGSSGGAARPSPSYDQLRRERGVPELNPTIYPPPVAFLMLPLGLMSFDSARVVFAAVAGVCAWVAAVQAGWVHRLLWGRRSRAEGLLILAICLSPLMVRGMRVMNISLVLGPVLGAALLAMLRQRPTRSAAAICLAGVFRASSGPLVVVQAGLGRWKSLAWITAATAAVLGLTLAAMGGGPVVEFASRGLPIALQPYPMTNNQSAGAFCVRAGWLSRDAARWVSAVGVLLLVAGGVRLFAVRRRAAARPAAVAAAGLAMMSVWFAFSPIFWTHYHLMLTAWWGFLLWSLRGAGVVPRVVVGVAWLSVAVPIAVAGGGRYVTAEPWRSHILLGSLVIAGWSWGQLERLTRRRLTAA